MKHLLFFLMLFGILSSCSEDNHPQSGVMIKLINNSEVDFDTVRMIISQDTESLTELVFTNLKDGKSETEYLDQLEYVFYDEQSEFIFFCNYFKGVTEDNTLFETGYGFCGTGLMSKVAEEGVFRAIITGVDTDNKRMFITQEKE